MGPLHCQLSVVRVLFARVAAVLGQNGNLQKIRAFSGALQSNVSSWTAMFAPLVLLVSAACKNIILGLCCCSSANSDVHSVYATATAAGRKGDAMRHPALPSNPIRSAARLAGSAAIKQLKPAPATSSSPAAGSIEVDVNVQQLAGAVPQDFLGISLEWPGIEYYAGKGNAAAWSNVLGVLGPGAIIRVGGSSQDKLTEVSTRPGLSL
jgi:hypothetical protein